MHCRSRSSGLAEGDRSVREKQRHRQHHQRQQPLGDHVLVAGVCLPTLLGTAA